MLVTILAVHSLIGCSDALKYHALTAIVCVKAHHLYPKDAGLVLASCSELWFPASMVLHLRCWFAGVCTCSCFHALMCPAQCVRAKEVLRICMQTSHPSTNHDWGTDHSLSERDQLQRNRTGSQRARARPQRPEKKYHAAMTMYHSQSIALATAAPSNGAQGHLRRHQHPHHQHHQSLKEGT